MTRRRGLVALLAGICAALPASAQEPQLPPGMTAEQAVEVLRQSPQLQEQLRQRVLRSGLTRSEIRQRLREGGFPPDLLDSYLFDAAAAQGAPDQRMLEAISLLGVKPFPPTEVQPDRPPTQPAPLPADTEPQTDALPLFGLDAFRGPGSAFEPLVTGPVDGSYVLGPGDVVVLIVTGAVQTVEILEVTREGFVVIPRVGQLFVSNVTLDQFRDVLYARLSGVYSGISRAPNAKTRFDITLARVRSQTIRVIGEVARPGSYSVAATGGVLSALYQAGGPNPTGSFRNVQVRRGSELVGTVDLYDYLLEGAVSHDVRLQAGDVVFVPVHAPRVKIAGEVVRPAIYELKPGETLRDLIRIAGGFTPYAAVEAATVDRVLPPDQRPAPGHTRTVVSVSLNQLADSAAPPVPLYAADSVTVPKIRGPRRNTVEIEGAVWQPGTYTLQPGMHLADLIAAAGGLRADSYEGRVQIVRTLPDSSHQLLGFPLALGDATGLRADDPPLREGDRVTVFATTDFRPVRVVGVHGAVRRPGDLAFADSMTLRDAILLAGGLTEDAYLEEIEVARLTTRSGGPEDSLVTILRVPLDSSYVVDATSDRDRRINGTDTPPVLLHPYDQVFVRRRPGWELQRNVVLTGEVRFPGTYTLIRAGERLLSIIERAGGLTRDGYPNGIQFFRSRQGTGRVPVDLRRALSDPRHRDNVVLEPGDSIHIPRFMPVVRVEGAVQAPANVTYRPGAGIDEYVDAAGGYAARADKGRTYVIQPNGAIEKRGRPEPGAVVRVPEKDPSERAPLVVVLGALAPVISAATTIVALLVR